MTDILRTTALLSALVAVSLQGCGHSKESGAGETPAYITEAQNQFGDDFECEPNATEEFILCAHRPETSALSPEPRIAFFVYAIDEDEVVYEQNEILGRAGWVSDFEIEVTLVPGIVTEDGRGAPRYRIDVRTGNRQRLDGVNEIPK